MRQAPVALLLLAALAAGCGTHAAPVVVSNPAPFKAAAKSTKAGLSIASFTGNGKTGSFFSTFEGGSVKLVANVSNPGNVPYTLKWDGYGQASGPAGHQAFTFYAWQGGNYDVACTLLDASGALAEMQTVSIQVVSFPSPPPIPPIPVPHRASVVL